MAFGLSPEGGSAHAQHATRATESPLHRLDPAGARRPARRGGASSCGPRRCTASTPTWRSDPSPSPREPRFHEMSHGESFLALLGTRFDSPGLYCLDEPEAALSFSAQIALVGTLHDLAAGGAQVLCATHSPLLAALPGAQILEVGPWGLREADVRRAGAGRALAALPRRPDALPAPRALTGMSASARPGPAHGSAGEDDLAEDVADLPSRRSPRPPAPSAAPGRSPGVRRSRRAARSATRARRGCPSSSRSPAAAGRRPGSARRCRRSGRWSCRR